MTTWTRAVVMVSAAIVAFPLGGCSGVSQDPAKGAPTAAVSGQSHGGSKVAASQRADSLPDGVYRKNVTEQELIAVGHQDASRDFGVQTLTVRNGKWHWTVRNPNKFPDDCGHLRSTAAGMEFREGPASCVSGTATTGELLVRVTWRSEGDRFYLTPVSTTSPDLEVKVGGAPWRKIS